MSEEMFLTVVFGIGFLTLAVALIATLGLMGAIFPILAVAGIFFAIYFLLTER